MENPNQDPETWIMALHKLNIRMSEINASYRKTDVVMISHILSKLPDKQYGNFNTSLTLVGYSQMTLEQFRSRVHNFWDMHLKNKVSTETDQAFKASNASKSNNNQGQNQVYTGYTQCRNCGKRGHKAKDCWQEGGGKAGQFPSQNNPSVTCFKCGQKGHYTQICGKTSNNNGNNEDANKGQVNKGNLKTEPIKNEAMSISNMFTSQEETGLFCGMIHHEPKAYHVQTSNESEPKKRWWADVNEESNNEDEEETSVDCPELEIKMPHLEEGIALGSKQKRQWWVDENKDDEEQTEDFADFTIDMTCLVASTSEPLKKKRL